METNYGRKYIINKSIHITFQIKLGNIPRPISSLGAGVGVWGSRNDTLIDVESGK